MRWILMALLFVTTVGCAATDEAGEPVTELTEEQERERWMAAASPGPEHELLREQEGDWVVSGRVWHGPDADPMEVVGEARTYLMLGGRFLAQEYKSTIGETEFEGFGIWGFDRVRNRYMGLWMDSHGTAISLVKGQGVKEDGTLVMIMQSINPDGSLRVSRDELILRGAAGMTYRSWNAPGNDPDRPPYLAVEMEYRPDNKGD